MTSSELPEQELYKGRYGDLNPHTVGDVLQRLSDRPRQKYSEDLDLCLSVIHAHIAELRAKLVQQLKSLEQMVLPRLGLTSTGSRYIRDLPRHHLTSYHGLWAIRSHLRSEAECSTTWPAFVEKLRGCIEQAIIYAERLHSELCQISDKPPCWIELQENILSLVGTLKDIPGVVHETEAEISAVDAENEKLNQSQAPSKAHSNTADSLSSKAKISARSREWNLEGAVTRLKSAARGALRKAITRLHSFSYGLGDRQSAYRIVSFFAIVGLASTILSIWKCTPSAISVQLDSNFWSTLGQTVVSFAGLYTIILPILRKADFYVSNKVAFYSMMVSSLVTAALGIIVYHFQTRTSLVLNFLSSIAQLFATLHLVDSAGDRLTGLHREISGQQSEIDMLRREIFDLRAALDDESAAR
ncbi:hypothetical protein Z517_11729 [Fonsecaea pedrosoi CBS 271.37]|uniref:Uncharacterized protein n=1 Tax=Fonsecaea pedrosoi CBS 271.37 TaxID=1442368 RepID=A0A0D2G2I1_9EURO|nr:uncharacterized protein Z517_11729 [Fonsecaea pedrosoi CBS 271.37]KIW74958.1 hypothetical protein Z517_11729 [Fonsecaea pedrosoi CBS 271.37]